MQDEANRRAFLAMAGAGALLAACRRTEPVGADPLASSAPRAPPSPAANGGADGREDDEGTDKEKEVTATEDLMREHGVIRRILVVYRESAIRLRSNAATLSADALQRAAKLMKEFGEDYHEKQLEEANIFPAVARARGAAASEIRTMLAQHERGREITGYVIATTRRTVGPATAETLASVIEGFARMYEEHAAREDTIVFPAWKGALSEKQLDEMGDLFEEIERKTFGTDGFEDAVKRIEDVERAIGLDPATLIAPPPPKL